MAKNIGKKRIDILENPYLTPIIFNLNENIKITDLALKLNKAQSTISLQLQTLLKEEYVLKEDNKYQVNHDKIVEEFFKYCNGEYEFYQIRMLQACMKSKQFKTINEVFKYVIDFGKYYEKWKSIESEVENAKS